MNKRSCKCCIFFPPERWMILQAPKAGSTPPHDAVNTPPTPCAEAWMTFLLTGLWPFYPLKDLLRLVCFLSCRHNPWCWEHSTNTGRDFLLRHRESSKQKARSVALPFCSHIESAVLARRRCTSFLPCRAWLALLEKPPSWRRSQ